MLGNPKSKIKFLPFLYVLIFLVVMYSVNDMATSTNAYQEQGNRSSVYIFLIGIIGWLGIYALKIWSEKINFFAPLGSIMIMTIWVFVDNLLLGNLLGREKWSALTHVGLSAWWILALVFGYYYPRNDKQKQNQLMLFVLGMFVYYCVQFLIVAIESNATHDETTILNLVYRVVVFVPAIYFLKNNFLKNALLLFVFALTVVSMKRGAIIILPLMLLASSFVSNRENKDALKKIGRIVIAVIIGLMAFVVADKVTGGFLSHRFSIDELMYGSSRSEKYAQAINEISKRGLKELIFGIGSGKRGGVHNEILEFLYTFGLVGLILYIALIMSLCRRFLQLYKIKSKYAGQYAMIVVYFFVVGIYSGVYFVHGTFYIMLVLGMIECRVNEEKKLCQKCQLEL